MALQQTTKTTFEPKRVIEPLYTGGAVALSEDGKTLATTLGEETLLSDLDTGERLAWIEGDGEPLTTLALTPDAQWLVVCSRSLSMRIYTLQPSEDGNGIEAKLSRTLKPHTTPVVTCAVDTTSSLLATGGADGVVKVWDLRGGFTTHTFHGHSGVISALHFFRVEGDAHEEKTSKSKKRKSREMNGDANGVDDEATLGIRLASGGEDGGVRLWNLHKRKGFQLSEAHSSVVRSLDYSSEHTTLLSTGRDQVVLVWDAQKWQIRSTIPVAEEIESAGFLPSSKALFTAGAAGNIRLWSILGSEMSEQQSSGAETDAIIQVLHFPALPFLLSVHADQTLRVHQRDPLPSATQSEDDHISALPILRRISGTHDEVIDLAYVGMKRDKLALATNLEEIRIIFIGDSNATATTPSTPLGADVALLKGHTDVIITLDTDWSGHWLATGAKDNMAKLWRLDPDNDSYTCYATFTGHAESIGAVALPNTAPQPGSREYNSPLDHPPKFLITGSQDKTVKRWDTLSQGRSGRVPRAIYTRKAHDKDINAIEVSYSSSGPLFASASQDRTVKIWDAETGEAVGVLRGHKRGVWTVAFSPNGMPQLSSTSAGGASSAKGMVVTGSGDKSVKIWSLSDYSCLRTFEGHTNSILKVIWLPVPEKGGSQKTRRGVQVASAAGDGLVKVWDAQEGECAATLDNHIDRVWSLAVRPAPIVSASEQKLRGVEMTDGDDDDDDDDDDDRKAESREPELEIVSGSADSTMTFWADTTASTALQASTKATARIEQDQELQNYIRASNYRQAIVLALQLNHPKRLLDLFTSVVNYQHDAGSFTGKKEVDEVLGTLSDSQLWNLLKRLRDWNANARTHNVAQHVLHAILRSYSKERLVNLRKRRKQGLLNDELTNSMAELDIDGVRDGTKDKESVKDIFDALRVYTERHHSRLEKTADERFVLLWALEQMDEVGGGAALEMSIGYVNEFMNGEYEADEVDMLDRSH